MRAPLSIVIPTLNAEASLPGLLMCLMEGVEAGLVRDLVVTDGGSTDRTQAISEQVGAEWVTGAPGRGGQLARGVAVAEGAWLLVLHADSLLEPGWTTAVEEAMAKGHPAYFTLRFGARGLGPGVVAGWANLRARLFSLPFGDQGLLMSRQAYEAAGGYPDMPLMEDVALARALPRLTPMGAQITTSWTRYERGWIAQGARNLVLQARYFAGASPKKLAAKYRDQTSD